MRTLAIILISILIIGVAVAAGGVIIKPPPSPLKLPVIVGGVAKDKIIGEMNAGWSFGHDEVIIKNQLSLEHIDPATNETVIVDESICSVNIWKEGDIETERNITSFHNETKTKVVSSYQFINGTLKQVNSTISYNVSVAEITPTTVTEFRHENIAVPIFRCSDNIDEVVSKAIDKVEGDQTPVVDATRPAQQIEFKDGSGVILLPGGGITP